MLNEEQIRVLIREEIQALVAGRAKAVKSRAIAPATVKTKDPTLDAIKILHSLHKRGISFTNLAKILGYKSQSSIRAILRGDARIPEQQYETLKSFEKHYSRRNKYAV